MFTTLHTLFETQYVELAAAVDEIAERIRALGAYAPASYSEFSKLSTVNEETGHPDAREMISRLADDQQSVVEAARKVFAAAEAPDDQATADLAARLLEVHEKNQKISDCEMANFGFSRDRRTPLTTEIPHFEIRTSALVDPRNQSSP